MSWSEVTVSTFDPTDKVVIDVRETDEYEAGHVPGAVNVPLSVLEQREGDIPASGTVYMICRSGARSGRACDHLTALESHRGAEFINVGGGTAGWIAEGREVVTGDQPR